MTVEADIETFGETSTVSGFDRIERTNLGDLRVYYDPDNPDAGFNPAGLMGPTDEGLFYEEYDAGEITAVRVGDNERDPQLMV